jgi:hypothetical protein
MRGLVVASMVLGSVFGVACGGPEGDGAGAPSVSAEAEAKVRTDAVAKPRDEPRDAGKGLAHHVRELVQAADSDPVLAEGEGVAIPAVIPPGDILIEHRCSHSMEPFGTTYWSATTTADLAKATIVASRVEGDTGEASGFFLRKKGTEKGTEQQTTLTPADVARIRTALDRVLAGGPYAPVYALSEGIVCTLSLRVGESPPFFRIDKSRAEREDSVTQLIAELGGSTPP